MKFKICRRFLLLLLITTIYFSAAAQQHIFKFVKVIRENNYTPDIKKQDLIN
jgi:hypothetical protein